MKNTRYYNEGLYKYNLQSKASTNSYPNLIIQHIFHNTILINHIYREDEKKESIDSLIRGKNKDIWLYSLSNKYRVISLKQCLWCKRKWYYSLHLSISSSKQQISNLCFICMQLQAFERWAILHQDNSWRRQARL